MWHFLCTEVIELCCLHVGSLTCFYSLPKTQSHLWPSLSLKPEFIFVVKIVSVHNGGDCVTGINKKKKKHQQQIEICLFCSATDLETQEGVSSICLLGLHPQLYTLRTYEQTLNKFIIWLSKQAFSAPWDMIQHQRRGRTFASHVPSQ